MELDLLRCYIYFYSNSENSLKYGTTGKPVPGYEVTLLDENNYPVKQGEIGELRVKGPSSALKYWRNVEKTKKTFIGEYTVSGDNIILMKMDIMFMLTELMIC